jgi:hypothetical protein
LTGVKAAAGEPAEHRVDGIDSVPVKRGSPMEFHIALTDAAPDPAVVQDALFNVDPTAVADLDMSGLVLRVSASATAADLVEVLRQVGWPVALEQVVQLPSICCGGCGG